MTSILIADDHPMIGQALEMLLRGTSYQLVGRARNGEDTLDQVERLRPDILLLDVNMPGKSGIDILRRLRRDDPHRRVILLTAGMDDAQLVAADKLQPDGIVLKTSDPALLLQSLDAVRDGHSWVDPEVALRIGTVKGRAAEGPTLTPRERDLVDLVRRGMRNREIAEELGVTEGTVKVYLHTLFDKLGVDNRTELAMRASELLGA
jgi:two-component system nitrate/nitrite response regulator NarP